MPVSKFSISLMPEIVDAVSARGTERSTTINKMLDRYLAMLESARRDMLTMFSKEEMSLILDALNGSLFVDTFSFGFVHAEIADAISFEALDKKWGVDGAALTAKLENLSYAHKVALVDAVERWWNNSHDNKDMSPASVFRR